MEKLMQYATVIPNSDLNTLLMSVVIIMLIFKFIDKTVNGNNNKEN